MTGCPASPPRAARRSAARRRPACRHGGRTRWSGGTARRASRRDADVSDGSPATSVTGLPDLVVRTTIDRVRAAIINAGYSWPAARLSVMVSPAAGTSSSGCDLAIAVAILAAAGAVPRRHLAEDVMFFAGLGLDGSLRPAGSGTAEAVACAAVAGMRAVITAEGSASRAGAAQAPGVRILTAPDLAGIPGLLTGSPDAPARVPDPRIRETRC